jgi:hypothetical protein
MMVPRAGAAASGRKKEESVQMLSLDKTGLGDDGLTGADASRRRKNACRCSRWIGPDLETTALLSPVNHYLLKKEEDMQMHSLVDFHRMQKDEPDGTA